jgi:alpha-L-arabinofuranosidase
MAFFLLNRDLAKPRQVEIVWEGLSPRPGEAIVLTGSDLKASNSFETPARVTPQKVEKPSTTPAHSSLELPPRSYTVVQWTA